jgi:hypothetical protein
MPSRWAAAQQLAQENAQLKAQAQSKAQELALKAEEPSSAQMEADKMPPDRLKLTPDAQRLDLDRLKTERELATAQQAADTDQAAAAGTQQVQQVSLDAVTALQGQLAALQDTVAARLQALLAAAAARPVLTTVTLHRDAAGTLVGQVHDPAGQVVRRLALARTADGYHGEVS